MASAFSADPSVLSHLRPLHLVLLLHSLSLCPSSSSLCLSHFLPFLPKGFNYIYSNLPQPHDSPVPCLISAKGNNSAGIEYQVWARGELLKEREGAGGRRWWDRATSTQTESREEEAEIIIQDISSLTAPHPMYSVCDENKGQWAFSFSPQTPGALKTEQQP